MSKRYKYNFAVNECMHLNRIKAHLNAICDIKPPTTSLPQAVYTLKDIKAALYIPLRINLQDLSAMLLFDDIAKLLKPPKRLFLVKRDLIDSYKIATDITQDLDLELQHPDLANLQIEPTRTRPFEDLSPDNVETKSGFSLAGHSKVAKL